jgi:HK97 family phage prohead protease
MTPAQLEALLTAGLITAAQHRAALATRTSAGTVPAPTIDMHLAGRLALDTSTEGTAGRTLRGIFSTYDELIPSHGMILHPGSLQPREPLTRVKVLRDHNHGDPLGYVTALDPETLEGDLYIPEGENGDRALDEAAKGIRDGLSVGFSIREYTLDDNWTMHVYDAELYEVSLCAIPAVADAGIYSVAAAMAAAHPQEGNTPVTREQLAAALSAGRITQEQHDAALAALEATQLQAEATDTAQAVASALATDAAANRPSVVQRTSPTVQVVDREQLSLREVTRRVAAAVNTGDTREVVLALNDIVPANDAGEAYVQRPEWLGELFTANEVRRPYIEAIGTPQPLAALRAKGYRWDTKPTVAEWAGNKTEVPTSTATTVGDDFVAFRIAAGWDIDRAFVDFGDEAFLADFWSHVVTDYQIKSEAGIRSRVKALKSNASGTVTSGGVLAVLRQIIRDGRAIPGSSVNRVFLSDTLFEDLEVLDTEHLPLWLKGATLGMDIAAGSADAGALVIELDSTLAAGEVVAFDNRGLVVRERQIPQVRAIDLAHGGIDLGFFSYLRLDDVDPRLVFRRKYTASA